MTGTVFWLFPIPPLLLRNNPIFMKDAQCATSNQKSNFRSKFIRKLNDVEYKINYISKTKILKIDFSFVSAHSLSFM